jgi:hypothetical protein
MNLTNRNAILYFSFVGLGGQYSMTLARLLHADDDIVVASDRYKSETGSVSYCI